MDISLALKLERGGLHGQCIIDFIRINTNCPSREECSKDAVHAYVISISISAFERDYCTVHGLQGLPPVKMAHTRLRCLEDMMTTLIMVMLCEDHLFIISVDSLMPM